MLQKNNSSLVVVSVLNTSLTSRLNVNLEDLWSLGAFFFIPCFDVWHQLGFAVLWLLWRNNTTLALGDGTSRGPCFELDSPIPPPRSAPRSLWLAVTRWWKPEDRGWGDGCTPGASLKVRPGVPVILSLWSNVIDGFYLPVASGEPVTLRLRQTEEHADLLTHARPQRCDLWHPLWELQSPVHTGDDQVPESWDKVGFVRRLACFTSPLSPFLSVNWLRTTAWTVLSPSCRCPHLMRRLRSSSRWKTRRWEAMERNAMFAFVSINTHCGPKPFVEK